MKHAGDRFVFEFQYTTWPPTWNNNKKTCDAKQYGFADPTALHLRSVTAIGRASEPAPPPSHHDAGKNRASTDELVRFDSSSHSIDRWNHVLHDWEPDLPVQILGQPQWDIAIPDQAQLKKHVLIFGPRHSGTNTIVKYLERFLMSTCILHRNQRDTKAH